MKPLLFVLVPSLCTVVASAAEPSKPRSAEAAIVRPFWLSTTMEGESILFIKDGIDGRPRAFLLFEPTEIRSVRSSSGKVTYDEGADYTWRPGSKELVLPPGSRILSKTPADLRRPAGSQRHALTHRDGNGEILFGATHEYHDMQTMVTYTHKADAWAGPKPSFAGDRLPRTVKKLKEKRPLAIALLGDSISTGRNASGWANAAPFQPPYQDLFVQNLEAVYGTKVTLDNLAVNGKDTAWGLANIDKVIEAEPDLVIIAFGMNDAARRTADEYGANIQRMVDTVGEVLPETEFILVATMLGNKDWTTLRHELFPQYRDALAAIRRPNIALADMTSVWAELLAHKKDWDMTGNGVNHPNDFGHRVYAQILSSLLIEAMSEKW